MYPIGASLGGERTREEKLNAYRFFDFGVDERISLRAPSVKLRNPHLVTTVLGHKVLWWRINTQLIEKSLDWALPFGLTDQMREWKSRQ